MDGATEEWRDWPPSMEGIIYSIVPDHPNHDRIQLRDLTRQLSKFAITPANLEPMDIDSPTALNRFERNPTDADENRKNHNAVFGRPESCMICTEKVTHTIAEITCGHHWCSSCIYELIRRAATDESAYPPKCCGSIIDIHGITYEDDEDDSDEDDEDEDDPDEDDEDDPDEDGYAVFEGYAPWTRYMFREEEYTTRHRTYCFSPTCGKFIPPRRIEDQFASCISCGEYTCCECKNKAHEGECPIDNAIQQTLEVAKANGWKSCPMCNRLIEKKSGCNHISYASPPLFLWSPLANSFYQAVSAVTNFATCAWKNGDLASAAYTTLTSRGFVIQKQVALPEELDSDR